MPLRLREFVADAPGPHLLVTGAVHGDEFEPIAAIRRLIDLFAAGGESTLKCGRLTLVPIVNEAAFLRGHARRRTVWIWPGSVPAIRMAAKPSRPLRLSAH